MISYKASYYVRIFAYRSALSTRGKIQLEQNCHQSRYKKKKIVIKVKAFTWPLLLCKLQVQH